MTACGCGGDRCRIGPDDRRHGTMNGYHNRKCRCRPCTTAATDWWRARRERAAAATTCPNCSGPGGIYADSVCHACHEYERRTGRVRPPEVYDPPERFCANCGKRMVTGRGLRHGRCEACSRYLGRHGVERPRDRWKPGEAEAADDLHLTEADQAVAS